MEYLVIIIPEIIGFTAKLIIIAQDMEREAVDMRSP